MEAMFLEIYNESLRDLLSSTTQTIDIKKDPQHAGEVYVTNVTPSVVTSQKQVCASTSSCAFIKLYLLITC